MHTKLREREKEIVRASWRDSRHRLCDGIDITNAEFSRARRR